MEIINKRILELLTIINRHYPDKFPRDKLLIEYEIIKNKIALQIIKLPVQPSLSSLSSLPVGQPIKAKRQPKNIDNSERCHARIWGPIFDRANNLEEIKSLPPKFQITDFAELNIKEFNKLYIVGKQCKRPHINGSIFCKQHSLRQIHGDYTKAPTREIVFHYLTDGNYL